jgi:hypothetical protein
MTQTFGFVIESLVAVLLVLTIGYCALLNKRLQRLRADEHSLKATIGELITATEIAERAIAGLKLTVRDCDQNLGGRLASAHEVGERLMLQIETGEDILRRLSRIALAARPAGQSAVEAAMSAAHQPAPRPKPPAPAAPPSSPAFSAQSIAAAAQAIVERNRMRGLAA